MSNDLVSGFVSVRIGLITVSDTRTSETDRSGDTLQELIEAEGHQVVQRMIVTDDQSRIIEVFRDMRDKASVDVVISTGGTGMTARDVTPEAAMQVLDKELRGFGEIFRAQSFTKIGTSAIQSRALAGTAGKTIFFVLPGSPGACRDAWQLIKEMIDGRTRPCNVIEMIPRM